MFCYSNVVKRRHLPNRNRKLEISIYRTHKSEVAGTNFNRRLITPKSRGGDLGGLGGRSLQSLRWVDGPCIRPPNILRSSVVGCARKYEHSFKKVFFL